MFDFISHAFRGGGFYMWPILLCGIFAIAIFIERVIYLYLTVSDNKDGILKGMNDHVMRGDLNGAIRYLGAQRPGPLPRILKSGLMRANRPDIEVQAALDEASLREVPKLEKRTGYLAVLSNAAVLIGLLGTITGMIRSFAAVAHVDPAEKATLLAAGISEAMNCTAFGLIVSIPSLFAFAFVQSRTQHIIDGINESVVSQINMVLANRRLLKGVSEGESAHAGAE